MSRPLVRITLLSATVSAFVACAASGTPESKDAPPVDAEDSGGNVLGDAGAPARDAADEAFGEPPRCSSAGWCKTELPVDDLVLEDVWPVGKRAFALGISATLGVKFLEWDAKGGWKIIDDRYEFPRAMTPKSVWAPDEDEVFFAIDDLSGFVGGVSGSIIVHGARPVPPETKWSWTRSRLDCPSTRMAIFYLPNGSVWGTSRNDVYALACDRIHRLNRGASVIDGGVVEHSDVWDVEYADTDATSPLSWTGAIGTGPDDVWFVGYRGSFITAQCLTLFRKTDAGYTALIDGVPEGTTACLEKPGVAMFTGKLASSGSAGPANIHAPAKERLVGAVGNDVDNALVQFRLVDGEVQIQTASPREGMEVAVISPWGTSMDDLWVLANRSTPNGTAGTSILRATSIWGGGGAFEFSTIAINGSPNTEQLTRLRGTSNQNLWAVGTHSAYVKSTP